MKPKTVEHATLQIFAGTVENAVNGFLIERRSRGLSKNTIWFYTRYLEEFCEYLDLIGVIQLEELNADIIRKYLLHLEGQGHNAGGVHAYFRCIRAMLSWWEEEADGDYQSPMRKVKAPKVQIKPLPGVAVADIQKMIDTCTTELALRDRAILLCLLDTGCRAGEFLALNIKNVDFSTGAIRIEHGKGDKSRTVYMGSKSRKALRRYLKVRSDLRDASPLWLTDEGERLQYDGLRQIVTRRAIAASVDVPGLHDFRRAFALSMLRNGTDLLTISRLLGHSSLAVTQRYLCQDEDDLHEGHRRGSPVDNAF